jgi:ribosomal protein S18 acetylase RimI-like enzyme
MYRLRAATDADAGAIADVWHAAWHDAHAPHVPSDLLAHRGQDHFARLAPDLIARSVVAENDSGVVGFVTVTGDELEFLFVAADSRGSGVSRELLRAGERRIGATFDTAWLEVVSGNARARRFYERNGWTDVGTRDAAVPTPDGDVVVAYHRYEKGLGG